MLRFKCMGLKYMKLKRNEQALRLIREMLEVGNYDWLTTTDIMRIREENGMKYVANDAVRLALNHLVEEGYCEVGPTGNTTQSRPKWKYRKVVR